MSYSEQDFSIIVDTDHVHQVGKDIASDAAGGLYQDEGSTYNLNQDFTNVKKQMPTIVAEALVFFQGKYIPAYEHVLQNRQDIGDLLDETASATEKREFQAAARFQPSLETSVNLY